MTARSTHPGTSARDHHNANTRVEPDGGTAGRSELLTPAEVAKWLDVGERTLERWRSTGGGPRYVKLSSKVVRYRTGDIAAFIDGNVLSSTAQ